MAPNQMMKVNTDPRKPEDNTKVLPFERELTPDGKTGLTQYDVVSVKQTLCFTTYEQVTKKQKSSNEIVETSTVEQDPSVKRWIEVRDSLCKGSRHVKSGKSVKSDKSDKSIKSGKSVKRTSSIE